MNLRYVLLILLSILFWRHGQAQYPTSGVKQRLGYQTTGDGLVYRGNGSPAYTPSGINSAWAYIDTTAGTIYTFYAGSWHLVSAGGGGSFDGHVDSLVFNTAVTVMDSVGKMYYDAANETISVGIDGGAVYQMGQELYYPLVINKSGATILNGQPVMVDTATLVTGDHVRIIPARNGATYPSEYVMGVVTADIPNDSTGLVTWFGYVREVKQSDIAQTGITLNAGDILYISATEPGKYTNVRPSSPAHQSTIALVVRKPSVNNITLLVRPWLAPKLDNLSNVNVTSVTGLSVLRYNSTTGTWDASATPGIVAADTAAMLSYYLRKADTTAMLAPYQKDITLTTTGTSGAATFNGVTLNVPQYQGVLTNPVTGTGTAGQVAYWSGTTTQTGSANFTWTGRTLDAGDNYNLGIGYQVYQLSAPTGTHNIGVGYRANRFTTTGVGNIGIGQEANRETAVASDNIGIGRFALTNHTTNNGNIGIGYNTGGTFIEGGYNVFLGYNAGAASSLFYGNQNTILGYNAASNINAGADNNLVLGNNINLPSGTADNQIVIKNLIYGTGASGTGTTAAGKMGILQSSPSYTLDINATDGIRIPLGTTAQRPTGAAGVMRYNSDSLRMEYHTGTAWNSTVTGTGTAGQVAYWSGTGTQAGSNNLFWDNTNARLGIGTNSPGGKITAYSNANAGGVVQNWNINTGTDTYAAFANYAGNSSTSNANFRLSALFAFPKNYTNAIYGGAYASGGSTLWMYGGLDTTNNHITHAITCLSGVSETNYNPSFRWVKAVTNDYTVANELMRLNKTGLGIKQNTPLYSLDINATDGIRIPSGTTAQRPTGAAGVVRYNSDSLRLEYHTGTAWKGIAKTEELPVATSGFPRAAPVAVILSTHTVGATDAWIICDYAGTVTLTLPSAASYPGREIMVKTIRAQSVVSASSNVAPIDSNTAGTAILAATAGKWATLVSTGSQWIIMQSN